MCCYSTENKRRMGVADKNVPSHCKQAPANADHSTAGWIRTRCRSACAWRSFRASFLESESPCSSSFSAGSTRAGSSLAIGESQSSRFRRWGMERVNWCGTTKAPMVSCYRTESCAKSPSCYRRRAPVTRWRKVESTGDTRDTRRCERAKPKHIVRRRGKSSD